MSGIRPFVPEYYLHSRPPKSKDLRFAVACCAVGPLAETLSQRLTCIQSQYLEAGLRLEA